MHLSAFSPHVFRCADCFMYGCCRYGICGSVQEKEDAGGGYECSGDGQESGTTRNWVVSFIVFAGVSLAFIKPLDIFARSVVLPAVLCELAEQEGVVFDSDGRVLMNDNNMQEPQKDPWKDEEGPSRDSAVNMAVTRKTFKRVVV